MSKIIAKDSLENNDWSIEEVDLGSYYTDLCIGFTDAKPIIEFHNLKFGYVLRIDNTTIKEKIFPPPGVLYVRSDQEFLKTERLPLKPNTEHSLYIWAVNGGLMYEKTYYFTPPLPPQPYPSWVWNNDRWNAPVEYPSDGEYYEWNEESGQWVIPEESR